MAEESLLSQSEEDIVDPQTKMQLDLQFNKILGQHANDIENIALDLLSRPGTPVVPLKLFMAAFKNFLLNKYYKQVKVAIAAANERQSIQALAAGNINEEDESNEASAEADIELE